jgi:hypothetical protein
MNLHDRYPETADYLRVMKANIEKQWPNHNRVYDSLLRPHVPTLLPPTPAVAEARAPLPAPEPPVLPTPETRRSTLTATISLGNDVGIRITLAIKEEDDDVNETILLSRYPRMPTAVTLVAPTNLVSYIHVL